MATITKIIERTIGHEFVRITAEMRHDDPRGLSDGFSVTGEVYEARGKQTGAYRARRGWDCDVAGCIHDTVLRVAPELAPLVAVHLADVDGTPMHAVENGWYFYSGAARRWEESRPGESWHNRDGLTDVERAARALAIDPAELPEGMDKAAFVEFADGLRDRWAAMAAEARRVLVTLPDPPTADEIYQARGYDAFGKSTR